jgi:hypothetical protein
MCNRQSSFINFKIMKRKLITDIICALIILLFVYTGTSKFIGLNGFIITLKKSPLLHNYSTLVAWSIILLEISISALLFFNNTRLIGLYAASSLMLVFTLYVGYMILFIPHLPCSCGGVIRYMSWKQHLIFNIIFALLAAWGTVLEKRRLRNNESAME